MESFGFEPDDDDCGRDGDGVSGRSFGINEDCEDIVVKILDGGGEDDDDAVAAVDGADTFDN
jgi:hypothetical protein